MVTPSAAMGTMVLKHSMPYVLNRASAITGSARSAAASEGATLRSLDADALVRLASAYVEDIQGATTKATVQAREDVATQLAAVRSTQAVYDEAVAAQGHWGAWLWSWIRTPQTLATVEVELSSAIAVLDLRLHRLFEVVSVTDRSSI